MVTWVKWTQHTFLVVPKVHADKHWAQGMNLTPSCCVTYHVEKCEQDTTWILKEIDVDASNSEDSLACFIVTLHGVKCERECWKGR